MRPLLFFSAVLLLGVNSPIQAQIQGPTSQDLYRLPPAVRSGVSSPENPNGEKGRGGLTNEGAKGRAFISLKAGETTNLLDRTGAGIIQRMWITINDRSPDMLRGLRLRMYWDRSTGPAVDVPLGDFFCSALGQPVAFENALFASPEGRSYVCYIPMPFRTAAKITLTNDSGKDVALLFFDIDFALSDSNPADALYFHASFRRQQPRDGILGGDVELLPKIEGKGRFLGVSVGLNINPIYGPTWWGEGEVKMYLDGDTDNPTINGTGAEDYIGTGWSEGFFVNRYQGCLLADGKNNKYAFYRFHIPDPIVFYHDFKATIQQIGGYFTKDVKALQAKGVPLIPVSLSGDKGFKGLREKGVNGAEAIAAAADNDWFNFYRLDDYAVTAYYYLDRP